MDKKPHLRPSGCMAGGVLEKGERTWRDSSRGPRDPAPELEAQHLPSRVQVPIREEIGYWEQTQSKDHPVRAETGRCWWKKVTLSQVKLAN